MFGLYYIPFLSVVETNSPDTIKWTDNVQAVASVLSIALVLGTFLLDKHLKTQEKKLDARKELVTFRVRRLVIEPNLQLFHGHFTKTKNQIEGWWERKQNPEFSFTEKSGVRNELLQFKKRHHAFGDRILDPLSLVSANFDPLRAIMRDFEDAVTLFLGKSEPTPEDFAVIGRKLNESRAQFLKDFFKIESDILDFESVKLTLEDRYGGHRVI
jgi:hypothetical protein